MEFALIKELWGFLSQKRKKQYYFLFFLIVVGSLSEFVSIGLVIPFLAAIATPEVVFNSPYAQPLIIFLDISNKDEMLLPMVVLFSSAAIISGIMRVTLLWFTARLSYSTGADLNLDIYKKVLSQNFETHVSNVSSEVINTVINKTRLVVTGVIYPSLSIISSTFIAIIILFLLIMVDPVISTSSIFIFGVIYLFIIKFSRINLSQNSITIAKNSTRLILFLQESLGGIRDIIIENAHKKFYQNFQDTDFKLQRAESDNLFIGQSPKYFMEAAGMVLIALIAFYLTKSSADVVQSIPILGVLALSAQRLLPLLQQMYFGYSSIKGVGKSLEDILVILRKFYHEMPDSKSVKKVSFSSSLELNKISFRYPNSPRNVFTNLNLNINQGDCIGLIGDSGCGKSTLLDIIMGLLTPTSGEIIIDGVTLEKKNMQGWQSNIAHVPQSVFLINESIEKNIAFLYDENEINSDLIKEVVERSQLSDFVFNSLKGIKTTVGEMGDKLSGGQKQRIGLARAMYKKPSVFIFDESTSALDGKTEEKIIQLINSSYKGKTIIMVAHRSSTLKNCNKIYKLDNNKILDMGSYGEAFGIN